MASAAVTGCADRADQRPLRSGLLVAHGVQRETPTGAPVEETVAGMTAFGYELYKKTTDPATNTVLSPMSLAYAFAMARAGAAGTTAEQLDRVFGFPAEGPHTSFNLLTRELVTIDGTPPVPDPSGSGGEDDSPALPLVAIANSLWIQDGFPVKEPFLHTLAAQYGAGARAVDFTSPAAAEAINAWVRQQTADRIEKLFDEIDPNTRVVLANAAYFKGDWKYRFEEAKTRDAPFTRAHGRVVQVPMMHSLAEYRYAEGHGWQAVELPYADSDLAMWVLVPTGATDPGDLLAPELLAAAGGGLRKETVDLSLPRWDFGTAIDLMTYLAEIGLTDLTDFSGISPGLFVSDAVHRANITVDERGTEAAAATGIALSCGSCGPPTVTADHPFAFAIVHGPTKTPLFIGHVADPTDRNDGAKAAASGPRRIPR